ncbi:MAG: VTT domain-containing protein [Betaproteobacteria bacterium]|nr:VTT domain-containing protein [Betaproteobacteria bacterium]
MHRYLRLFAVLLFLGVLLAIFELPGLRDHFNLEFLRHEILGNKFSGLLLFVLLFSLGNLIHVPGWVFLAAAVLALGRIWGGVVTYLAATVSCTVTFLVIRLVGGNALRTLNNKLVARILRQIDGRPVKSVFALRVLFQTAPSLNYALAISGIDFWNYLAGTVLGLPLPIAAYCLFFDYLAKMSGIR